MRRWRVEARGNEPPADEGAGRSVGGGGGGVAAGSLEAGEAGEAGERRYGKDKRRDELPE